MSQMDMTAKKGLREIKLIPENCLLKRR